MPKKVSKKVQVPDISTEAGLKELGEKLDGIDLGFLSVLTVGTMRQSFPEMCDMNLWNKMGAQTWADKAFTQN